MDLILWRHAEAEESIEDLTRRLTPKGRKQAVKMAGWLNARIPETSRIIVSPAVRARETAEALDRRFDTIPALAPGASVESMLKMACWPGYDEECTLIVGHQPDLGTLAAFLLGADGSFSIKKGGIWWLNSRTRDGFNEVVLRAVLAPEMA